MKDSQLNRAIPTGAISRRRAKRWGIVLSVPLLLFSMLIISMQDWSVVRAAAPLQVGTCISGQTHATIQAAVNAAVSGTVINICPGTYPESVGLSRMSSVGDITLRRVPGQTGDVLVSATISPSFWITYNTAFTGSITLESLKVKSTGNHGIDFLSDGAHVLGSVVFSNVVANENELDGARVSAEQDFTAINSEFSDNGSRGLYVENSQNATVVNTQANNNGGTDGPPGDSGTGIMLYVENYTQCNIATAQSQYTVNVTGTTANENQGWGVYIESGSDINIDSTDVYSNAYDGLAADADNCGPAIAIRLSDSAAEYNGAATSYDSGSIAAAYMVKWGGFRLASTGQLFISGSEANENIGFGFCYYSEFYDVPRINIWDSLAENNTAEGFLYESDCDDYGRKSLAAAAGDSESQSEDFAIATEFNPTLVITNSSAISNGGLGGFVFLDYYTPITLSNVTAMQNINGVLFGGRMVQDLAVAASIAIDSVLPGLSTYIDNSLIQSNIQSGVAYTQTPYGLLGVTADFTSTNSISSTIICENGTGLLASQGELFNVNQPPPLEQALLVDARGNWWGSTTGPTHPDNPGGTGDSIVESVAEIDTAANEVDVTFAPWINTIDDAITPNTTLIGLPVDVEYHFRDGTSAYFLQNGVGDPNNGPLFTLSATNGTVQGNPQKFIVANTITGGVTPTAAGTMSVVLTGPCGLISTQEVLVVTPAIAVEKSPDSQGVAEGDSAVFTVTVTNSGNITLTDISVTDPVASSCARATGALGDLGISASTSYTCSLANVTNNFVNTVGVEGFALIDGNATGDAVSDSDTASVYVASLVLTKTVFLDGYFELIGENSFNPSDCALNSNITVPVSSTVKYCYTVTNTGDYTVTTHSLVDSDFPTALFSDFPQVLGPGESYSNIDAGVEVTKSLTVSVTNVATWTAEIAAPVVDLDADAVNATLTVAATASATAAISPDNLDQDADGIPDNIEGTGDLDNDGIPNYLDAAGPTNAPPTQQPGDPQNLFLPALGNQE